ncbi:MAG: nicotinamide riboside transporter PnuC [Cytophagales bacterium]|nr:nicotinamide riboside transporter PnuC [Cytophagales bacterium]
MYSLLDLWQDLYNKLIPFSWTDWIELIGATAGVISVWYGRRGHILFYPIGLIYDLAFVYLCFRVSLYANMGIYLYYTGMSLYGWVYWLRSKPGEKKTPISFVPNQILNATLVACLVIAIGLYFLLEQLPQESQAPLWDALSSSFFVIGMWLMARKHVEAWYFWILGDAICLPLYAYTGLYFGAIQFLIFLVLGVQGLLHWRREALHTQSGLRNS